ncbi:C-type lectin domain family 3 member A isoform X2 [Biomphalaria glabrata]|uniref:C-type lectin domain-containing protein n=1 Tax=Biomphalaria glabrata TaxID=6526 RepID=A0A2C9LVS8_BIOGL|nr:C-type lectin domain family 3 member A isoform X2 [Biomphalaria glabrata]
MAAHLCTIISLLSAVVVPMLKAELTVNATPTTFTVGLTKNVKIECSFSRDPNTNLLFVTSLNLAHSKTSDNPEFQDLISITSFDSQVYGSVNTSRTQVYGVIDNKGKSFLGLVWDFPTVDRAGVYKCEATGLNKMGKHVSLSNSTNITALNPENSQVLDLVHALINKVERLEEEIKVENKIDQYSNYTTNIQSQLNKTNTKIYYLEDQNNKLTKLVENYKSRLDKQDYEIDELKKTNGSLTIDMDQLQMRMSDVNRPLGELLQFKDTINGTFNALENAFLTPTHPYNGKRYWLTKNYASVTPVLALLFCQLRGGYLAEIDSPEEYAFVRENLLIRSGVKLVYISGSDEEQEGHWKHMNSKTILTYLNWGGNENIGGRQENCLGYHTYNNWLLADVSCPILTEFNKDVGYMCELPS